MSTIKENFSISDYIKIFIKYKYYILIPSLVVALITAFIVFVVISPIFYSYGTIKTTGKSSDLSSLIGSTSSIGGMDLGELAGGSSSYKELALFENIILSRKCLEPVIIKFNIMEEEDLKYMNDAIKYFKKNILEVSKDKIAGTMEIGIYDKNPEKAKQIVEQIIFSLNKINIELNVMSAKNNREFLEKRYSLVKEELRNAEDSLKIFQDKYGIAPDLQIKAATQLGIQFEADIKAEEVKLELQRKILTEDQPEIKQQKEKIQIMKDQLNKMMNSRDDFDMLALKGKPDIAIQYLRLTRNLEIQNKILAFILPIYEQAKVEERKETPTLLILDDPFIPDKKAKPSRLPITIVSFVLAFFLSFGIVVIREKWLTYRDYIKDNE